VVELASTRNTSRYILIAYVSDRIRLISSDIV
jgi:hypothetical protein